MFKPKISKTLKRCSIKYRIDTICYRNVTHVIRALLHERKSIDKVKKKKTHVIVKPIRSPFRSESKNQWKSHYFIITLLSFFHYLSNIYSYIYIFIIYTKGENCSTVSIENGGSIVIFHTFRTCVVCVCVLVYVWTWGEGEINNTCRVFIFIYIWT